MSKALICDLCGKLLTSKSYGMFKVKRYHDVWERWERLDVHDECLRKLLEAKREASIKENEDGRTD